MSKIITNESNSYKLNIMLSQKVLDAINRSVLCWLATSSAEGVPNVSPKEVFCAVSEKTIIIANIASPGSKKNISENSKVCVSFIDILVQKGFQLKGLAEIIESTDSIFPSLRERLEKITLGKFPFSSVFVIHVEKVKPIIAPSYVFYPNTSEKEQIEAARRAYDLK